MAGDWDQIERRIPVGHNVRAWSCPLEELSEMPYSIHGNKSTALFAARSEADVEAAGAERMRFLIGKGQIHPILRSREKARSVFGRDNNRWSSDEGYFTGPTRESLGEDPQALVQGIDQTRENLLRTRPRARHRTTLVRRWLSSLESVSPDELLLDEDQKSDLAGNAKKSAETTEGPRAQPDIARRARARQSFDAASVPGSKIEMGSAVSYSVDTEARRAPDATHLFAEVHHPAPHGQPSTLVSQAAHKHANIDALPSIELSHAWEQQMSVPAASVLRHEPAEQARNRRGRAVNVMDGAFDHVPRYWELCHISNQHRLQGPPNGGAHSPEARRWMRRSEQQIAFLNVQILADGEIEMSPEPQRSSAHWTSQRTINMVDADHIEQVGKSARRPTEQTEKMECDRIEVEVQTERHRIAEMRRDYLESESRKGLLIVNGATSRSDPVDDCRG